jgi:hypothetical protein
MRRFAPLCLLLLPLLACGGGAEETPAPDPSEFERAIGESGLPGAQGVRGARDAVDAAGARAEAHDTIGR